MPPIDYLYRFIIKLAFVYLLGNIVISEGLTQDQYVGCFHDSSSQFPQWENTLSTSPMTVQICIDHCRTRGLKTYAKLQNGTVCQCGDDYGIQMSDSACKLTCSGNELQYCGGVTKAFMTTYVLYAVCPVGNFGANCSGACHCKRLIPCRRDNGRCPDGCDGNYTGSSCNSISLSQRYIGCYADSQDDRTMTWNDYLDTLELCIDSCTEKNYSYAGAQFGSECWCGEIYDKHGQLNESRCNMTCAGNLLQFCGYANVLSTYSACPVGRYGKDCIGNCNCLNNGRCVYRNGSCSSAVCKSGWIGTACNLRDCSTSNGDCDVNEKCMAVDLLFANKTACRCSEGFTRRNLWELCTDIDECSETPSRCGPDSVNCTNTYGSYICLCKDGRSINNGACAITGISQIVDNGVIIGAVLGSVLGMALVALVTIVAVRWYRRKHPETPPAENPSRQTDVQGTVLEQQYSSLVKMSDQPNDPYSRLNVDINQVVSTEVQPVYQNSGLSNNNTSTVYEQLNRNAALQDNPSLVYASLGT